MAVISVKDLKKTYNGSIIAVDGLTLEVEEGSVFGFLGPNGAGKSTSINIMTGKIRPTSGSVTVMGHKLPQEAQTLATKIGYVPQDLVFYDYLTVQENLKLFASCFDIPEQDKRIHEVMQLLAIDELAKRRADQLSGGQKRRLNLAIGLLHKPKLLFLDEPSAGMDPQSRNILWETIENMGSEEKITIILTTHLMETAERLSDRVAIIDEGKIKAIDTPEALKKQYSDGDVVEVTLDNTMETSDVETLQMKFESSFGKESVILRGLTFKITNSDGISILLKVSEEINTLGLKSKIKQLSLHESSLEDVFIRITGSALRED